MAVELLTELIKVFELEKVEKLLLDILVPLSQTGELKF